jgi:hypothetical protein
MLLILTTIISNRLRYIAGLMLSDILGLDVGYTTSREEFANYPGPKISYAMEPLAEGIFIKASALLFETSIILREVQSAKIDGVPVLFESAGSVSALAFDPFAAAFYMVSRYEEYYPHEKDSFGRYLVTESIAWKGRFLDNPVVHLWADALKVLLLRHHPGLKFRQRQYHFVPTIDIDHAWCYLGRPFARTMGGFSRSLLHGRLHEISDRFKVLTGLAPDPYDNYSFISLVHEPYGNMPVYFILFADYGFNDNNVTVSAKKFHQLLRELDQHGKVGIHPSLSSNRHLFKLEQEYDGLCEVLNRDVTLSRQHFLKLAMPETYRNLLPLGITDDYSMGYASQPGFRAGIAIPFPFYDLVRNEVTSLIIHPVTIMDVTMKDYLRLNKVQSLEKIAAMIRTIRAVNGEFVSLWHNESLGDTGRWKGWREVYHEMIKLAAT